MVSGDIGTGTSTLAKNLAVKLGWEHHSTGDFFRAYHLEHSIPLWNASAIPAELDKQIDNYIFEQLCDKEHLVLDSHYAAWFARDLKNVFKILLTCDIEEVVRRVTTRTHTHKETENEVLERIKQLDHKFRKLYAEESYLEPKYFDLIIDTTSSTPEKTLTKALSAIEKGLSK